MVCRRLEDDGDGVEDDKDDDNDDKNDDDRSGEQQGSSRSDSLGQASRGISPSVGLDIGTIRVGLGSTRNQYSATPETKSA